MFTRESIRWLLVLCAVLGGVASFTLNITPERARVSKEANETVTILCSAEVPLVHCQVSWWAEKESPGPVLDLQGPKVPSVPGVLDYSYSGRGLAAGDCGVKLQVIGKKVWTVGCRVLAAEGGWRYATMELLAYSTAPLPGVEVERSSVVVLPGKEVSVMCSSPQPVDACYLSLPGKPGYLDFYKGLSSDDSAGRHIYRGAGQQSGQCGLTWRDISEADNGPIRCYLWKAPKFAENRGIHIIVARAPDNPALQVSHEGETLQATCTVTGSRPVAEVQWLLDDDVIRNDALNDVIPTPGDEWAWPWSTTTITQKLTRRLKEGDYGKVLRCVTSHVVLEESLEARWRLSKSGDEGPSGSVRTLRTTKPHPCPARYTEGDCQEVHACPVDEELRELRLKEAQAALKAAQLAEEAGRVILEAAKSSARAEDARARSEEARAREEDAWAKNAAEEVEYERERRNLGRKERKT